MGQRQFIKIEGIRAYYDESNKEISDYDQILPITVFDAVRENYDDETVTLTTIINLFKTQMNNLTLGKQNILQPGTSGNIAIFTGEDGVLGEIEKTDSIVTNPTSASPNKLVTEKAIVDFHENILKPEIADAAGLRTRVTNLETGRGLIQNDISGLTGRMTTAEGNITYLDTKTTKTDTNLSNLAVDYDAIKAIVTAWKNAVLNPNGGAGSFKELQDKVTTLDSETTKTSNFGDGKYIKSIDVKEIDKNEISISHEIDNVNGSASDIKTTVLYSSDNSVNIELMSVGNNNTIDITTDISRDDFNTKLDKNGLIPPGTATKVIYDDKGLITGTLPLIAADIPNVDISKVNDLQLALNNKTNVSDFNALNTKVNTKADQTTVDILNAKADTKVTSNAAITGGTTPKVTFDSKGLVTGGSNLSPSDIPNIDISKVNDLQTALDVKTDDAEFATLNAKVDTKADKITVDALDAKANTKVTANNVITAGTATKVTYDNKGLVISGTNLSASDIPNITVTQVIDLPAILDSKADVTDVTSLTNIVNTKAPQTAVDTLNAKADTKITANVPITGKTVTKVTYDEKGLVTGGSNLSPSDIPNIDISKVNDLQANLDSKTDGVDFVTLKTKVDTKADKTTVDALDAKANTKVTANNAITAGTVTKVTYDEKGLVTGGTTLSAADIPNIDISKVNDLQANLDSKTDDTKFNTLSNLVNTKADKTTVDALNAKADTKITANVPITAKTATKVTYDAKGLVIDGVSLLPNDIPNIAISQVNTLQTSLNNKTNNTDFQTLSDKVDTKADKTTVNDLQLTVDGKANSTTLTELANAVANKADISQINALDTKVNTKITANPNITPSVATKVAFDKHGLITSTSPLVSTDIPDIAITQVAGLEFALEDKATTSQLDALGQVIDGMIDQSELDALHTIVNTKLDKNAPITSGTGMKLTYDSKGLIVGKVAVNQGDIPSLAISKIIDLQTELDQKVSSSDFVELEGMVSNKADQSTVDVLTSSFNSKVTANAPVTAKTATKVTYDAKGLVTGSTTLNTTDLPIDFTNRVDNLEVKANTLATKDELNNLSGIVNLKVVANEKITAGVATKVTYDDKGLVTSGTNLTATDIPNIAISKINTLQATLDSKTDGIDFVTLKTKVDTKADQSRVDALNDKVNTKVTANDYVDAATHTKITYDSKGLVIAGKDLVSSDIPNITINQVDQLPETIVAIQHDIDSKVVANNPIVGTTATKVTYDNKGLVTHSESLVKSDLPELSVNDITGLQTALGSKTPFTEFNNLKSTVDIKADKTTVDILNTKADTKVTSNAPVTGSTATKITYDDKGLVTGGVALIEIDIPILSQSKITGLTAALASKANDTELHTLSVTTNNNTASISNINADITQINLDLQGKVDTNPAITPGVYTKVLVDAKGLVTHGAILTASDIPDIAVTQVTGLQGALDSKADVNIIPGLQTAINNRVVVNPPITAGTATKVTFDAKGLITQATYLSPTDIPVINTEQVSGLDQALRDLDVSIELTDLQNQINTKVVANAHITASTGTKVTYDEKGLVTGGSDITTSDLPIDFTNRVYNIEHELPTLASKESLNSLTATVATKVISNTPITPGVAAKVKFDAKGLIIDTEALKKSDLPELVVDDIVGLPAALIDKATVEDLITLSQTMSTKASQTTVDNINIELTTINTTLVNVNSGLVDLGNQTTELGIDISHLRNDLSVTDGRVSHNADSIIQTNGNLDGVKNDLYGSTGIGEYLKSRFTAGNNIIIKERKSGSNLPQLEIEATIPTLPISQIEDLQYILDTKATKTTVDTISTIVGSHTASISNINSTLATKANHTDVVTLTDVVSTKVDKNAPIIPNTGIKITYDAKGLITGSAALTKIDLPVLGISDIPNLQMVLDSKGDKSVIQDLGDEIQATNNALTVTTNKLAQVTDTITSTYDDLYGLDSKPTSKYLKNRLVAGDHVSINEAAIDGLYKLTISANVSDKVDVNPLITAGTGTKITYDEKGLVTHGDVLAEIDIPVLSQYKISGLVNTLASKADVLTVTALAGITDTKVNKHSDIAPGVALKVAYDKQGLITSSLPLTLDDLPEIEVVHVSGLQALLDTKANRNDISLSVNAAGNLVITWNDDNI